MWSFWKCVHALSSSTLFSLAAVNPDVYTGSSALAPACRVPGVLSAVRDVRQQTGMAWPAGRAVLDGSAVSVVDRQACGSDLTVTGCQSHRRATNQHSPLSSHLTIDRGEALNSQLGTRTPLLPPLLLYSASIVASKFRGLLYLWNTLVRWLAQ